MRAREFLSELDTTGSTPSTPQTITSQPSGTQDTGKLTAMISGLQKQIQDLQKSALQTSAATTAPAGAVAQQGSPASAINPPQPAGQPAGQVPTAQVLGQPAATQNGVVGKPAGGVQGMTAPTGPANNANNAPGVNQSPQVTNMKIKQQLAQNQGLNA